MNCFPKSFEAHYPPSDPLPFKDEVLADLMLPEGAHLRERDWTTFFAKVPKKNDLIKQVTEIRERAFIHRHNGDPTRVSASYSTFVNFERMKEGGWIRKRKIPMLLSF